jgi:Tol biopolymer transport system component
MKIHLTFLCLACSINAFAQKPFKLALNTPPSEVALLGEGNISTFLNERDFAMSPDGNEIYYTISTPRSTVQMIVFSRKIKGDQWTSPEIAAFSGTFSDLEPAFSADGKTLYFASNRPVSGEKIKDYDLWKVHRAGSNWGPPENLGPVVNSTGDEFYPSVTKNGNLYFTATFENGVGKEDIFVSTLQGLNYQKPVPLDTAINSKLFEFNAFVSPDEDYILFSSFGRKDDAGGGDLYFSMKDLNGKWLPAVNLKALNSPDLDYCPYVSPDGKTLFFTSLRNALPKSFAPRANYQKFVQAFMGIENGNGNIYWVDFKKIKTMATSVDPN